MWNEKEEPQRDVDFLSTRVLGKGNTALSQSRARKLL